MVVGAVVPFWFHRARYFTEQRGQSGTLRLPAGGERSQVWAALYFATDTWSEHRTSWRGRERE
jgi:hypothetical protein